MPVITSLTGNWSVFVWPDWHWVSHPVLQHRLVKSAEIVKNKIKRKSLLDIIRSPRPHRVTDVRWIVSRWGMCRLECSLACCVHASLIIYSLPFLHLCSLTYVAHWELTGISKFFSRPFGCRRGPGRLSTGSSGPTAHIQTDTHKHRSARRTRPR